ncbi:hypothetical protein B7494_g7332 [Chlorociboria aeruginascens]|nr:hypothetical protein B7494_g7332 [Chlorociboria aeruginascens]
MHPKHEYNFHDDETLHDQTPDPTSLLSRLPAGGAAIAQFFAHGGGDMGKRAAVAQLPMDDPLSKMFMATGVKQLYNYMLHPPNILYPELGKAGLPYAKSVQGKTGIHGARPDPGDLFDLLMARKDDTESSSGISSMLLYHATIIIHDIFRTNTDDKNISDASSYLDLSPLYGVDQANQDSIRQHTVGLLKPDTFAEKRLLLQPPGVCIYLIMYNRFHNYVAKQLLEINENGKFSLPFLETSDKWKALTSDQQKEMKRKQDEDLFQTARLITCGLFINISIHDYLRILMGFHAFDTAWTLDPRIKISGEEGEGVTRATGNMVSVEFNLLYRFHSAISVRDRKWAETFFSQFLVQFMDKNLTAEQIVEGDIDVPTFKEMIERMNGKGATPEQKEASLAELSAKQFFPEGLEQLQGGFKFKRDASGKFDDAQLAAEMAQVIEDPICQFGAQNIPKIFKAIEVLGILQARKWYAISVLLSVNFSSQLTPGREIATLNEFREFFGMERHKHFEDINEDPGIINALRDLYEDPDMVELYPGLMCEGSGRCLDPGVSGPNNGSTALWGGVFSDAITLVRSDRFYTVDWNVASLTSWGMREVSSNSKILKGSVFHRLFQRAFPGYFKHNSIHLWQPFVTPAKNIILANQQKILPLLDLSGLLFDSKLGPLLGNVLDPEDPRFRMDLLTKITPANLKSVGLSGLVARRKLYCTNTVPEVARPAAIFKTSNYGEIRYKILGSHQSVFQNPGTMERDMIKGKYLQDMMMGKSQTFDAAALSLATLTSPELQKIMLDYFVGISKEITEREQRKFQKLKMTPQFFADAKENLRNLKLSDYVLKKELQALTDLENMSPEERKRVSHPAQTYQLDVVKDYAIPIITRFFADFLGFWDKIKTPSFTDRKYNENQIYQHINNCQDYLAYNSDETTQFKRRLAFRDSISFLKEQAEYGVHMNAPGFLGRTRDLRTTGDEEYVVRLRQFGVQASRNLANELPGGEEEVAAMMLTIALDTTHKTVMTFTEVLAYFIDNPHEEHPDMGDWINIQKLAYDDSLESASQLKRYVLEAQRLRVDLPLMRTYAPVNPKDTIEIVLNNSNQGPPEKRTLISGDKILLQLKPAQQDPKIFPEPATLNLNPKCRLLSNYLIYGEDCESDSFDVKQLTLAALTGMIKYIAKLKDLRVAHDKLGRLKRAKTPLGVENYLTVTWDELVPFPTTWCLRFNGEGRGVYTGPDNADQGHGIDQVYQKPPSVIRHQSTLQCAMSSDGASELIRSLLSTLISLSHHPYPYIPNPPSCKKRASVALVLRIRPSFSYQAPAENPSVDTSLSTSEQIKKFFEQEWVRHGDPEVVFIKRAAREGDRWTSHVALPGGKRDPEDEDDKETAMRETREEIGLDLKRAEAVCVGNLPERVVSTSWGKVPIMVLCPFLFLWTSPTMPPLQLQPAEVASIHWVPLRVLLSPSVRTYEYVDVSERFARQGGLFMRTVIRSVLGKMIFSAIRLVPSESLYCSSTNEFFSTTEAKTKDSIGDRLYNWYLGDHASSPGHTRPLLLWGLTLGMLADFLDQLPPYNAVKLWDYPTFTSPDVRWVIHILTYGLKRRNEKKLYRGGSNQTAVDNGSEAVDVQGEKESGDNPWFIGGLTNMQLDCLFLALLTAGLANAVNFTMSVDPPPTPGTNFDITWSPVSSGQVSVLLNNFDPDNPTLPIITTSDTLATFQDTGSYTWAVPSDLCGRFSFGLEYVFEHPAVYGAIWNGPACPTASISVYPTTACTPTASATPTGANPFLIPNADEYPFRAGEERLVTWTPTTSGSVSLVLNRNGESNTTTLVSNIANSGSYAWSPDPALINKFTEEDESANSYFLTLSSSAGTSTSNTLDILSEGYPTVFVNVSDWNTPTVGLPTTIEWSAGNESSIDIELVFGAGAIPGPSNTIIIGTDIPNTGSWIWDVPSSFTPGQYILSGLNGATGAWETTLISIVVGSVAPSSCGGTIKESSDIWGYDTATTGSSTRRELFTSTSSSTEQTSSTATTTSLASSVVASATPKAEDEKNEGVGKRKEARWIILGSGVGIILGLFVFI